MHAGDEVAGAALAALMHEHGARPIRREHAEAAVLVLDEPHESAREHAHGGRRKRQLELRKRAELVRDRSGERLAVVGRHRARLRRWLHVLLRRLLCMRHEARQKEAVVQRERRVAEREQLLAAARRVHHGLNNRLGRMCRACVSSAAHTQRTPDFLVQALQQPRLPLRPQQVRRALR